MITGSTNAYDNTVPNVFFLDYYKLNKNHGLDTYTSQLGSSVETVNNINFNYVWLNSPDERQENNHFFLKRTLAYNAIDNHSKIAGMLLEITETIIYPVFHFNWIGDLGIARALKKVINCCIILTKHCIPWRDLVTSNYLLFTKINHAFNRGESLKFMPPILNRELVRYDAVDHIITVTDFARKSLIQLFKIDPSKVTRISNGLKIKPPTRKEKARLRKKYGFNDSEKLIIYAGNVNPRKGIYDIVRTLGLLVKRHPDLRLLVAGPGNYEELLKQSKDIWSRITICGSLDKPTLYDFYAMCDIGIVPSYIEQCSYTCIEMMHCKLPLIVSNVDGLKEMVNDNCGRLVKVDFKKDKVSLNQQDLIRQIHFLLDNQESAGMLAENAKKYAIKHFTAQRMARETIAVYKRVLRKKIDIALYPTCRPLISVIVPCYNVENFLQDCLDSINRQSLDNFEIILINDGSTDGTDELIRSQTDARIVYLKNDHNIGIARTLNKAVKIARGKYIARMDADDTMHTERFQMQVDFLETHSEYGFVGSWHNIADLRGIPLQRIQGYEESDEIKLALLFYNSISHPTVMMRSELAIANPYNVEYSRCEDYELWFRLTEKSKVKNLPQSLVNYRVHQNNTVGQHGKEMQRNVMSLLSSKLEEYGITHTPGELLLHCAIGFGMGKKFFNTKERIDNLNHWLDKVFANKTVTANISKTKIKGFRKHLVENCCEVHFSS